MTSIARAIPEIDRLLAGETVATDFVTPLFAVAAAALSQSRRLQQKIKYIGSARSYASTIGLVSLLEGSAPTEKPTSGKTYSGLATLSLPDHVEAASGVINDFVYERFRDFTSLATRIGRVVGELHDNVTSHSRGTGYSAAQVYSGSVLEVAIADNGVGMRRNVERKLKSLIDDAGAIQWCLQKGNTTADALDDLAQWLPSDATASPYPPSVQTFSQANHHVGEGLWQLSELVKAAGGSLFVWSGRSRLVVDEDGEHIETAQDWSVVIIEFSLQVAASTDKMLNTERGEQLEALARRLGI